MQSKSRFCKHTFLKEGVGKLHISFCHLYLLQEIEFSLYKNNILFKVKIEFYGKIGWTVLSHITLPLCIFYR